MTWLLALYPPRWRRRYGDELRELIGSQPLSFNSAIDLIAGAIDAWIAPQKIGATMTEPTLRLACAGWGESITKSDARKSLAVNLGGTILLCAVWMFLHIRRIGDRTYVDSFSAMTFLVPYLFSLRYTSLRGRSLATQSIFIGGMIAFLTLLLGSAGWIASKL